MLGVGTMPGLFSWVDNVMRQSVGTRKVRQLAARTGLPVVGAQVRGGTDHRIDLCLSNGSIASLYRDGKMTLTTIRWRAPLTDDERREHDALCAKIPKGELYAEFHLADDAGL
jgi:hypothetical protein